LGYLLLWCCCCCLLLGLREVGGERGRGKIFLRCEKKVGGEPGCGRRAAGGRWPHPKYPAVRSRHVARLVEGSRPRVRRPAGRGGSEASGDDAGGGAAGRGRAREKTSERDTRAHEAQLQARRPQLTIWPTCQQILFFSKSTFGWAKSARFTQGQTDFFLKFPDRYFFSCAGEGHVSRLCWDICNYSPSNTVAKFLNCAVPRRHASVVARDIRNPNLE
jgi:hypothetical protein